MRLKLYIDNQDAYLQYGVLVTANAYKELVTYAPLKSVVSNNWQEEDGEEFDLTAPVLDSRELSIEFAIHDSEQGLGALIELLSTKAYHTFEFREINRTYTLRLIAQPTLALVHRLGLVTLRFADDFPLRGYEYKAPSSSVGAVQGCEMDGVDFSAYGVVMLQGCREEIRKSPSVKGNLLRNIHSQSGATYDGEVVSFATKEVKLNCLMRASSLSEFWQNYDALLFNLTRPGERMLYVQQTGGEYPCFYKNSSVEAFVPAGKIWFEFSLTLVFTSFRVGTEESAAAHELRRGERFSISKPLQEEPTQTHSITNID